MIRINITDMKALKITVNGDLYRKGYRYQAIKKANELNLYGFIQYLKNGEGVTIHAQGQEEKLLQFVDWCRHGAHQCNITSIGSETAQLGYFRNFSIATNAENLPNMQLNNPVKANLAEAYENTAEQKSNIRSGIKWLRTAFY